ncbi:MAG TPA: hypothetical protein VKY29_00765 [Cryomorphaceae bacterium]|nr:hypothetical protein [Cryomorphaceae bacterium]
MKRKGWKRHPFVSSPLVRRLRLGDSKAQRRGLTVPGDETKDTADDPVPNFSFGIRPKKIKDERVGE